MKKVLLLVPEALLQKVDRLIGRNFYANRNEMIRTAMRDLVEYHQQYTPKVVIQPGENE